MCHLSCNSMVCHLGHWALGIGHWACLRCAIYGLASTAEPSGACTGARASSSQEVARTSLCVSLCEGTRLVEASVLLGAEEADDLFEGTTEKGDVSSFEVCAAAVLKGKEAWENGVGIRSLISRAVANAAPCWSKVVRLPRLPRFVRCQL